MVKLTELTLNNVLQDTKKYKWAVIGIDKEQNLITCQCIDCDDKKIKSFSSKELNYVRLNKEWLKRFRFTYGLKAGKEKIVENGWHSPSVTSKKTNIYKINLHPIEGGSFYIFQNKYSGFEMSYVHELQNYMKILSGRDVKFLSKDMKNYVKF